MAITTKHQSIISSEFVGIDYAPSPHLFNCQIQKRFGTNVWQDLHLDYFLPFQDAENRDFVESISPPFAFSLTSKICLVHLHFTTDQTIASFTSSYYTPSDQIHCLEHSRITYLNLLSNLVGRKLQLKQLYDPKPVNGTYPQLAQPSPRPFKKGVTTPLATKTTIRKSIKFIALAPYAVPPLAGFHNRFAKNRLAVSSVLTMR